MSNELQLGDTVDGGQAPFKKETSEVLSAQALRLFFGYKLSLDRRTGMLKDGVTLEYLNSFQPASEFERNALDKFKSNFEQIANLSNDEWGEETKITSQDASKLEKLGFPSVALSPAGHVPGSWSSLNRTLDADPAYKVNLEKAGKLREAFRVHMPSIDTNQDGNISMSELQQFEEKSNLDVGAKQLVKFMHDNFNSLTDGNNGVSFQSMGRLRDDIDASVARANGNLDGADSAIRIGSLTGLGAMAGFYGLSLLGLALPPAWVPLTVGVSAGFGAWLSADSQAFNSYLVRYGHLMPMLTDATVD